MVSRRRFLLAASALGIGTIGGAALYSRATSQSRYARAVADTWRHWDQGFDSPDARLRALVHYASLAPSSHNTQCWKFRLIDQTISILPDFDRRCPVVDPDDHHLFVSLGCAAENILQSAGAMGLHAQVRPVESEAINILLEPVRNAKSPLFDAIPQRQSTRSDYDGRALSNSELQLLEAAGTGDGVRVVLLTDPRAMNSILELVIEGNSTQLADPRFVAELKEWIRFDGREAARAGDGLFAASSGNPTLPRWLGARLFEQFLDARTENDKYARQVRSSAGIAVFVSESNDKAHWVRAGQAFQRFALQATAMNVRTAHLNQAVEVPEMRVQLARFLGLTGGRPDLVIRFGRGPEMPRSLRRPLEHVLVQAAR